ncbi:vitamin B12 ABC transporter ATP-binding protein BtuD [Vibrio sp. SM6]|uniref:Vitamin B12 import ATP-binding protein BtuD n=2 Tax=Vibrio agarilyticus TaxID=2726741 RepID=A0A7X8TQK9_9VIBR|nr:vitamin B12 ABC transporter ATP-binding protein BtuD [Vibrio agarilyticus]
MQVNHLSVGHRLLPLSFRLGQGDILHVVGPNGAGKSTLLAALSGLLGANEARQGEVLLEEEALFSLSRQEQARVRAYLPQQARPAFQLDLFQFLALSLPSYVEVSSPKTRDIVTQLVSMMQLEDKLHRSIQTLSGGEWQRARLVAICLQVWRSLNPRARLLILDEPATALDVAQEAMLYQLIEAVAQQGISVVLANHDLNRTLHHAKHVLLLKQGVMQAFGEVDDVMQSQTLSQVFETPIRRVEVEQRPYLILT